jgi:acetyltransferase-like isoleucine patch superfamily enzyme
VPANPPPTTPAAAAAVAATGPAPTEPSAYQSLSDTVTDESTSAVRRYQNIALGSTSLWALFKYELITLVFGSLPGALGMALRGVFYPLILGAVGRGVVFGRNITVRHGAKIRLGDHVVIDDYAVIDAKGDANEGIDIQADSMISRNCILSCKGGNIRVGRGVALGPNSLIHAIEGSDVTVGDHAAIAAFVYLIGGGNYHTDRLDMPMKKQGIYAKGGVVIGRGAWVGSHVQVLDGVTVGADSIVAAGSVVNRDVPEFGIAGGVPARLIKSRRADANA